MAEQSSNTYQEQLQKIEQIANGVNLDTLAHVIEVLRHRQRTAQETMEHLKSNPQNVEYAIGFLNAMNKMIGELLITNI